MQDLKEIRLLVRSSEANNTMRIRIGLTRGIWSGMVDILPVTGRLIVRVYRVGFYPSQAK